jgi:hypothetical protein
MRKIPTGTPPMRKTQIATLLALLTLPACAPVPAPSARCVLTVCGTVYGTGSCTADDGPFRHIDAPQHPCCNAA